MTNLNITYLAPQLPGYGSDLEDFPGLSLPLLKDLHPNIAAFGRRGETYASQLTHIKTRLDEAAAHPKEPAPILTYMPQFIDKHNPEFYPHYRTINDIIHAENRPDPDLEFLTFNAVMDEIPQDAQDNIRGIINHPCFTPLTSRHASGVSIKFLYFFTHHSLYRDLLTRYRATHHFDRSYVTFCQKAGIPA